VGVVKAQNGTLDTETLGAVVAPSSPRPERQVQCGLGVIDGVITFTVGEYALKLTVEAAEELAVDLRKYAIEVRNGGRVG
jgi:hypothetical protein